MITVMYCNLYFMSKDSITLLNSIGCYSLYCVDLYEKMNKDSDINIISGSLRKMHISYMKNYLLVMLMYIHILRSV